MTEKNQIVPIDKEFKKHSFKGFANYAHAANSSVMPIVISEVNLVMMDVPLILLKEEDGYKLFAISSLINGINVLIDGQGKFRTSYIPACYRAYPFVFAKTQTDEKILCFNEASGLLLRNSKEGEAFFDEQGNLTETLQTIISLITHIADNMEITKNAIKALEDMQLITPWEPLINITGKEQKLEGVFGIDEQRFFQLSAEELLRLRDCGAMNLVYAQIFSKQHIKNIESLSRILITQLEEQNKKQDELVDKKGDLALEFLNEKKKNGKKDTQNETISFAD